MNLIVLALIVLAIRRCWHPPRWRTPRLVLMLDKRYYVRFACK
jgi:hypothetical protein